MTFEVIILAAGKGSRMKSALPKVLHPLAGRPLLHHVVRSANSLHPIAVHIVVGHGGDAVRESLADQDIVFHEQAEQLGTGHAVMQALPHCRNDSVAVVLYGDVPLISSETIHKLSTLAAKYPAMLSATVDNPAGYGRVIRDESGEFASVVEDKDASDKQRQLREVNTGVMAAPVAQLSSLLEKVENNNAQGEYYLPDVLALAREAGQPVEVCNLRDSSEMLGVNDRLQLEEVERIFQRRQAESLMEEGVSIADRSRIDIRGELVCGDNVSIDVNVVFEGRVVLSDGVTVGANCVIKDTDIAAGSIIHPFCHIEAAAIGSQCQVGPYARLRQGTQLGSASKVGNFVETKNTDLGEGSKANHLTYLGDTRIGEGANIGAGTITCNYDGVNKHPTQLGDRVFIGSNSTLVAPVNIEDDGFVGAGSVITGDVASGELALGRSRQRNISGWQKPTKKKE